jgi:hypothetical protein
VNVTPLNKIINDDDVQDVIGAENRLVVKAVLMGCDAVVHRFLCAYVVLLTDHPDITNKIQVLSLHVVLNGVL